MQRTAFLAAAILALALPAHSADRYAGYDQGVFLEYVDAPTGEADITSPPHLRISFGGERHLAIMDTGSTGVVVSASDIPNVDQLPGPPGKLTYSSSGRVMIGRWVTVAMTVSGKGDTELKTAPLPVLAVTRIDCLATARTCKPGEDPHGVALIGIGFARRGDHQEESAPDKNPFVAAALPANPAKPDRRGYIVTRTGIEVGLTQAATSPPFAYVKLAKSDTYPGEWAAAPVCLSVNGRAPAACGTALPDTGVSGMFITLPETQAKGATTGEGSKKTLTDGTTLAVSFGPPDAKPAATYRFTVGAAGNPLAPDFVVLNTERPKPFINTSVHFLDGFDYLYDADGGYVGYRWTGHAPAASGSASPSPQ